MGERGEQRRNDAASAAQGTFHHELQGGTELIGQEDRVTGEQIDQSSIRLCAHEPGLRCRLSAVRPSLIKGRAPDLCARLHCNAPVETADQSMSDCAASHNTRSTMRVEHPSAALRA